MIKQLSLTIMLFLAAVLSAYAQTGFITTWTPGDDGSITIPTKSGYTYNYNVVVKHADTDEVLVEETATGNISISDLPTDANVIVEITGTFPAIYMKYEDADERAKLISIDQWGNIEWQTMEYAFYICQNITYNATDNPDLSEVTSLKYMFYGASLNGDISDWDVSHINNMNGMFFDTPFTGDISNWDVSSVTNMGQMFQASDFTGDISNWDVSSVTNMASMFTGTSFNQDISGWDMSNVVRTNSMFSNCSFNQDISGWNLSNVEYMSYMFWGASSFNQDISGWDVSKVTNFNYMFKSASSFNQDISSWDVSSAIYMNGMFYGASSFDQDLSAWSAPSTVEREDMFTSAGDTYSTITYNDEESSYLGFYPEGHADITLRTLTNRGGIFLGWNTASDFSGAIVTNIAEGSNGDVTLYAEWELYFITKWTPGSSGSITIPTRSGYTYDYNVMVKDANTDELLASESATGDITISGLPTESNVKVEITGTFPAIYMKDVETTESAKIISIDQWGAVEWQTMEYAFYNCSNCTSNATDNPDLSSVTNMAYMFANATSFNGDISGWDVSNVTDMKFMFTSATSFNQDLSAWNVGNVTNMHSMFSSASNFNCDLTNWDVSKVKSMYNMFCRASAFNGDISEWNVGNVTNMQYMFFSSSFTGDISEWNVSSVTSMNFMFAYTDFNGDISEWNVEKVTDMWEMFSNAKEFNGDISGWNVGSVTRMQAMFYKATSFNKDLTNWDVSKVINMANMFNGTSSFNGDISTWTVSNVTNMGGMFLESAFNGNISAWDVSKVTNMSNMFFSSAFSGDISEWDVSNVSYMGNMFKGASSFSQDLSSWSAPSTVEREDMFTNAGDTYYTITYNEDGTEYLGFYPAEHEDITLRTLDEKDGESFYGWNTASDFSGESIGYIEEDEIGDLTIYAEWGTSTSLNIEEFSTVAYYPNPVINQLNIEGLEGEYTKGAIYNSAGVRVVQFNLDFNQSIYQVDMSDYASGIYLLQLQKSDGKTESFKIIKK